MPNDKCPVILIVEDETFVRLDASEIVAAAGYEVLEAQDAEEAIRLLEARTDIRIVFTDIEMPGSVDGLKLAACVRDRWPPVEIIITSGRVWPPNTHLPSRGVFLPKPYRPEQLIFELDRLAA